MHAAAPTGKTMGAPKRVTTPQPGPGRAARYVSTVSSTFCTLKQTNNINIQESGVCQSGPCCSALLLPVIHHWFGSCLFLCWLLSSRPQARTLVLASGIMETTVRETTVKLAATVTRAASVTSDETTIFAAVTGSHGLSGATLCQNDCVTSTVTTTMSTRPTTPTRQTTLLSRLSLIMVITTTTSCTKSTTSCSLSCTTTGKSGDRGD